MNRWIVVLAAGLIAAFCTIAAVSVTAPFRWQTTQSPAGRCFEWFGNDTVIQAGGGIHGHPDGTVKGAKALRQAVDAAVAGITLEEYAKTHNELSKALTKWPVL